MDEAATKPASPATTPFEARGATPGASRWDRYCAEVPQRLHRLDGPGRLEDAEPEPRPDLEGGEGRQRPAQRLWPRPQPRQLAPGEQDEQERDPRAPHVRPVEVLDLEPRDDLVIQQEQAGERQRPQVDQVPPPEQDPDQRDRDGDQGQPGEHQLAQPSDRQEIVSPVQPLGRPRLELRPGDDRRQADQPADPRPCGSTRVDGPRRAARPGPGLARRPSRSRSRRGRAARSRPRTPAAAPGSARRGRGRGARRRSRGRRSSGPV